MGSVAVGPDAVNALIGLLRDRGFTVVGPAVRDGAVVYAEMESADDLPRGWADDQEPGAYRLRRREDGAYFGYVVGPGSLKPFLYPPRSVLWKARRAEDGSLEFSEPDRESGPYAFFGVRSCDLAAIAVQDRVFRDGEHADPEYSARRRDAFVVAVGCNSPASTCFCVSMGTGPSPSRGPCATQARFDLSITELLDHPHPGHHAFLVDAGSRRGEELISDLRAAGVAVREADQTDETRADEAAEHAAGAMARALDADLLPGLLTRNPEHPRWDDVGERCLGCTNCTMVCPTCFCCAVEEVDDLSGAETSRERVWDSCFTTDFAFIHGGSTRTSSRARYRHWLTHKMDTWHTQFGTSGCVGCGRCITWCPVGIDVTEEVAAIAATAASDGKGSS